MALTAMTYNIRNGGGDRLAAIARVVAAEDPDVLALQELKGFPGPAGRALRGLAESLGRRAFLAGSWPGQPVAVLVRPSARVLAAGPVRGLFHHAAARVVLATDAGPLTVVGTHLWPYGGGRRLFEARQLARLADPARAVLLLGDLNSLDPGTDHAARLAALPPQYRGRHLRRSLPGWRGQRRVDTRALAALGAAGFADLATLTGPGPQNSSQHETAPQETTPTAYAGQEFTTGPGMRLDYALGTPPVARATRRCRVVRGGAADTASDHYPLVVELAMTLQPAARRGAPTT